MKRLTRYEPRQTAVNIARLLGLRTDLLDHTGRA
jgi:hypothetical protein